jgi:Reverse transcriptase (RNA-dependent DNA polymerase)
MAMKSYNYQQGDLDHTMFFKKIKDKITVLIIYIDDMIIIGDYSIEIEKLEKRLSKEFEMKNLGGLKYFLDIEVSRSKLGIFLSQRKYILDLLAEIGMLDYKPADTLMAQNMKFSIDHNQVSTNKEQY